MKQIILFVLICSSLSFAQERGRSKAGSLIPKTQNPEVVNQQINYPSISEYNDTKGKEYYTPFLVTSLVYKEPSGNNSLDANEEGKIYLAVKNIGKLPAEQCDIQVVPEVADTTLQITGLTHFDALEPGTEKNIVISIKASENIKTGQAKFTLKILEKNGFDLDPQKILLIPTREYQPPVLEIVDFGIEDQNRDLKIEKFEKVDLTVRIQNKGENSSQNTKAKIILGENIMPLDLPEEFDLGEMKPGEYKDIKAVIVTNARANEVKINVDVTERTGKYPGKRSIRLPFDVVQKKPDEIIIAKGNEIKADVPEVLLSRLDIAEDIPYAAEKKTNAVAVIIGNKDYADAPKVDFALNDAAIVKNYIERTMGYQPENIIYVENAKQSELVSIFGNDQNYRGRLYDFSRKGLSEVFIYYSGHGAPDPESKQGYIIPVDCDPNRVALNGYSIQTLYKNLDKLAAEKELKQITLVMDACFSGNSEKGNLLSNISPVYITIEKQALSFPNSSIFTSASGDQVSTWYLEKKQGLFTYFFLKGLKGAADFNKDNKITSEELYQYTADEVNGVPYWARRLNPGRIQVPCFYGSNLKIRGNID